MTDHTEIPDDVMMAAVRHTNKVVGFHGPRGEMSTIGYDATVDVIARAILAERERCARIAQWHQDQFREDASLWLKDGMQRAESISMGQTVAASMIVAAIRK